MTKWLLAALAATVALALGSGGARAQTAIPQVVDTCSTSGTFVVGSGGSPTVDTTGALCTNASGGGGGGGSVTQGTSPWVDNVTQWASGVLGAMAAYGTSPGAVLVPGMNAFVTNTVTVTANAGTNLNTSALALDATVATTNTDLGAPGAATCATDTGSCNINAKLSRIAERLTALLVATAVTIADGADVTQGAIADAAYAGSGSTTVIGALKGIYAIAATSSTIVPTTTGGLSSYFLQPTASDNHANIKNGAGQVYRIVATNNSATINYLRLYDIASGFNGCGSATSLITQIAIPASTSGAGFVDNNTMGITFATGISICVTSGYATNDTTNATASAMSVSIGYK